VNQKTVISHETLQHCQKPQISVHYLHYLHYLSTKTAKMVKVRSLKANVMNAAFSSSVK